jgi:SET family sugar efflux transporter-like MFS transporter
VLSARGFSALFVATATALALVAVPLVLLGSTPRARADAGDTETDTGRPRLSWSVRLSLASFLLFFTAMFSGSVALPLYVTDTLGRSDSDVGLLFSVCAVAEIPAAIALMALTSRRGRLGLILFGMVLFVVYFATVAVATTLPLLLATQIARGIAIAVVGALGITHFQNLLPRATGRATTLFANTSTGGALAAGVVAGSAAQALGYREALLLCGVISAVACLLLIAAQRAPSSTEP